MTGCNMATALPGATADGGMLFAHHARRPAGEGLALLWAAGRSHAAGESVRAGRLALPQARRTHAFLGACPAGAWGCLHGVNEHGVAMGAAPTRTRVENDEPGLTGADLVRLTLERATCARQAVDLAADLIARHGQGRCPGLAPDEDHDNAFLLADGKEAYLLAACGRHWAEQQVGAVRALNESCHLRQDWDRLSPGLSDLAIRRGWWPEDGSKLDFAGALAAEPEAERRGYRWWGQATMRLEQHRGGVDHPLMRRLLAEPDDSPAPPSPDAGGGRGGGPAGVVGLIAQTGPADEPPLAWCSFGPAGFDLYFPLPLTVEPPASFRRDALDAEGCDLWRRMTRDRLDRPLTAEARAALAALQTRFDQTAGEFRSEAAALRRRGDADGLARLAASLTQNCWERFEEVWEAVLGSEAAWETACRMDAV